MRCLQTPALASDSLQTPGATSHTLANPRRFAAPPL